MKSISVFAIVAVLCIGVAVGGEKGEGKAGKQGEKPGVSLKGGPAEFNPLTEVLFTLRLSDEEIEQSTQLRDKYEKVLSEETEKARVALENAKAAVYEQLVTDVRNALTPDNQVQLDVVLALTKKRDDALAKANEQYQARLTELFPLDAKDGKIALQDAKSGKAALNDEGALVSMLFTSSKELAGRYKPLRMKHEKLLNDELARPQAPATEDKADQQPYWEAMARAKKAAEERFLKEAREMLNDDQRLVLVQAVEAQKLWLQAVQTATETWRNDIGAATGAIPGGKIWGGK